MRCGCSSSVCACVVESGDGIEVSGTGTAANPYVVSLLGDLSLTGRLTVEDSPTVDLTLSGEGTITEPWIIRADATISLDDLTDVDASDTTPGYVLTRLADDTFAMLPGNTVPTGTIITDDTIDGDGSVGLPLSVHDYDNIAWLEGADAAPNLQSIDFGEGTDSTVRQIRINRATNDGSVAGQFRSFLTNSGAGTAQSATMQYLRDGAIVGSLAFTQVGNLLWSTDGTNSFSIPYRVAVGAGSISFINQSADFVAVNFPAGRFTSAPFVTVSIATTGPNNGAYGQYTIWAANITANSMQVFMRHVDGTPASLNVFFRYIAIQL